MRNLFYLLSISLIITSCGNNELEQSIERGEAIYTDMCMRCHMPNGLGDSLRNPPLAGSNWLVERRKETIHATKFGLRGKIIVNDIMYDAIMLPMNLSDKEVADVLNYVMNSWGNTQEAMVTEEEVGTIPKKMVRHPAE